jgi:hypothetical protein
MQTLFGRVISTNIGEVGSIRFGTILIECSNGERHDLRYTKESQGYEPAVHDYVDVRVDNANIVKIEQIEQQVGNERFTEFDAHKKHGSTFSRFWLIPGIYYIITGVVFLLAVFLERVPVAFLMPGGFFIFSGLLVLFTQLSGEVDPYGHISSTKKRLSGVILGLMSSFSFIGLLVGFIWNPEDINTVLMNIGGWLSLIGIIFSFAVMLGVSCLGNAWD